MRSTVALVSFRYAPSVCFAAAAVTVCYFCANVIPACKQVEFTGNVTQQEAKVLLAHRRTRTVYRAAHYPICACAQISIVVTEPNGVTFGSTVLVYSSENPHVRRKVLVPSIDEGKRRSGCALSAARTRLTHATVFPSVLPAAERPPERV